MRDGLNFSERVIALRREVTLETVGLPAIVAVKRFGERVGALFHCLYEFHPPSPKDLQTVGGAVRRAVRDLLPTRAGHLGNAIPNWMIHGPEVNLGFAIPDPAKMIFLSAVRSAAKVLNLRRNEERAPTSPVNQCLVEEFVAYAGELEKSKRTNWAERVVPPLKISQECPYPAVMMDKWALVVPLDILDFGPISTRRLAANRATSQWPWLLTAL